MKFKNVTCLLLIICLLALPSCSATYEAVDIEIVEDKSFFSDVKEQDGYVYYYCTLTLKNNTNELKSFRLEGVFGDEYEKGIITAEKCYGVTFDGESDIISIKPNGETEYLEIVFVFEKNESYTETPLKENRLLPEINIVEQ